VASELTVQDKPGLSGLLGADEHEPGLAFVSKSADQAF
jgi:hypothetical protein